jgi:hypothetical protein
MKSVLCRAVSVSNFSVRALISLYYLCANSYSLGFACFLFLLAFLITIMAAIYYSPLFCGSLKEKTMLRAPQELDNVAQVV